MYCQDTKKRSCKEMTKKRFTIKPQDDLFGVVDNYSPDKIYVLLMVFVLKSKQNGYVM